MTRTTMPPSSPPLLLLMPLVVLAALLADQTSVDAFAVTRTTTTSPLLQSISKRHSPPTAAVAAAAATATTLHLHRGGVDSPAFGSPSPFRVNDSSFQKSIQFTTTTTTPTSLFMSSQEEDPSSSTTGNKRSLPFWLDPNTRGGVIVLSLLLFLLPLMAYSVATNVMGIDELEAGKWIGVGFTAGASFLWVFTYIFRVATKDMTYAKQLKDYENAVIAKRLEELDDDEIQALVEEIERDEF